jgi:hypothetical protein
MRLLRAVMILGVVCCAGAATPLAGQQVQDSARVVPANAAPASSAQASHPSTTAPGPRISPRFQSFEPSVARSNASVTSSPAAEGGSHTIVISTLALVLIVIIIVLLLR